MVSAMILLVLAILFCGVVPFVLAFTSFMLDYNAPHFSKPPAKLTRLYAGMWACCLMVFIVIGLVGSPVSPELGYWLGGFLCVAFFGLLTVVGFQEYGYN
jgi:hypothetical protein